MPEVLYEEIVEVEERVVLHQDTCQLQLPTPLIQGNTGEKVCNKVYRPVCAWIAFIYDDPLPDNGYAFKDIDFIH